MIYYIYDGSFDGILTAIYDAYYRRETPEKIVSEDDFQESFLINKIYIKTDREKADKVYNAIETKISNQALKNVFYVYLSERTDRGTIIYHYLKLGWKIGIDIDLNLTNNNVLLLQNICQSVSKERHFMLGLVRFRELKNNILYAPIEPEYNVIGLIGQHFSNRISNENWIIHDVNRNIAAIYNKQEWIVIELEMNPTIELHKDEETYQRLWKEYFNNISIKNKVNPRLQKRNMPMKYWKYLIEK
ncbi:TIGR03915 family putative DNA repair protein [Alkaliphilus sp. B6464]|uniref:TIGR03915 family putative DNA repair protein n=1 Tax=Alkaliphilus sp. B6464 TaxID=2731219 RepID=UPI001BA5C99B|nr:TIGR03915 family putative DNA repair protein [Alkaliphilus sp. B6464]QUH18566.1 TIGR03915 family putative DNA repair protein [Alkaliphilus sp. B6464]